MSSPDSEARITIDTKQYVIHIHQPTYRTLGEPKIIQLLLDPRSRMLIILCPDKETPGGQEVRVKHNKKYCDLCSKALVSKIQETLNVMKIPGSYRLEGKIEKNQHLAVFPMSTMKFIQHTKESNGDEAKTTIHIDN